MSEQLDNPDFDFFETQFDDSAVVQEQRLLEIQLRHNERLSVLGMLEKAEAILEAPEEEVLDEFTIASIYLREGMERDEEGTLRLRQSGCIRFSTPTADMTSARHISYVEVMHRLEGDPVLTLDNDFTSEEAVEFLMMADELYEAKNSGFIPDLSPNFSRLMNQEASEGNSKKIM